MKKTMVALCGLFALTQATPAQFRGENELLKLESEQGTFRITDKASGKAVISDGRLADPQNTAIVLPPGLPFALISRTLHNRGTEPIVTNRVPLFSATVAVPGELTTVGTGGLQPPSANSGSYVWLAIANPGHSAGRHMSVPARGGVQNHVGDIATEPGMKKLAIKKNEL